MKILIKSANREEVVELSGVLEIHIIYDHGPQYVQLATTKLAEIINAYFDEQIKSGQMIIGKLSAKDEAAQG